MGSSALLVLLALAAPNAQATPGVVRPLTREQVCSVKWGRDRRHVSEVMKREIARRYARPRSSIRARGRGACCEVDHLIPRELGGADDVDNLWPQPWLDAHRKDVRENQLHGAVCNGSISLAAAQSEMRQWGRGQPEDR